MNVQKIFSALVTLTSIIGTVLLITGYGGAGGLVWALGYLALLTSQFRVFADLRWSRFPIMQVVTRACFTFGVAGPLLFVDRRFELLAWGSLIVALLLIRLARSISEIARGVDYEAANLPGVELSRYPVKRAAAVTLTQLFLPPVLLILAFTGAPGYAMLLLVMVVAGIIFSGMLQALKWRSSRAELSHDIVARLNGLNPEFAVHWSAPINSAYQLKMWIPYFERIGVPFFIIMRNRDTWGEVIKLTDRVPIVWTRTLHHAEAVLSPTLTTLFYVNNADKNAHMVRHNHLRHIQLLHGDSEKASSYNPVTAMFDRIYVAGQAAIDRYKENGVNIPREKFAIVGRPQVEGIVHDGAPIASKECISLLYAPTWNGFYRDTAYSSLPLVTPLLSKLLVRGVRIVFRPHPYSANDPELHQHVKNIYQLLADHAESSGIQHLWGPDVEEDMTVNDCFNLVDAMIADVSSVVTDFLFSGKPLGIMTGEASPADVIGSWKLGQAAYIFSNEEYEWDKPLIAMLKEDPLYEVRSAMREYYLGDFPAEGYSDQFVRVAREDIDRAPKLGSTYT